MTVARVIERDLPELLPLMRSYCDFYAVSPTDDDLLAVARALLADPRREGVQLLARGEDDRTVGFATVYWSWDTLAATRIGIMYDLYVEPDARRQGVAESLIGACRSECVRHGAAELVWQTARDNERAQRVYDRIGAKRSEWIDYSLPVGRTRV